MRGFAYPYKICVQAGLCLHNFFLRNFHLMRPENLLHFLNLHNNVQFNA
jgi:hypothetical protein